jgi:acyl-CoA reductase-like NAD-dependent aldehyde dehydrogenase
MSPNDGVSAKIEQAWNLRESLRRSSLEERVARARACAPILEKHRERLIDAAVRSAGCIRKWATAQVDGSIRICKNAGERTPPIQEQTIALPYSTDTASLVREPFGVVGLVTPGNSPYRALMVGLVEAIVSGNGIVIKPSSASIGAVREMMGLLEEVLGPSVQITEAPGTEVARAFTSDPRIGVIRLYGNFKTGVEYLRAYAEALTASVKDGSGVGMRRLKSFILELSGNDPLIVLPGADVKAAVAATVQGSFLNSGQVCLCAKRIIVHRAVAEEFVPRLLEGVRSLKLGPLDDPTTDIGPLTKSSQVGLVLEQLEDAKKKSGRILTGGGHQQQIIEPTIVAFDEAQVMRSEQKPVIWADECFGPIRALVICDDLEGAHRLAADTSYGLGATIFGRHEDCVALARRLDAGRVVINTNPAAHVGQTLPFGGTKDSGLGGATHVVRDLTYGKLLIQNGS